MAELVKSGEVDISSRYELLHSERQVGDLPFFSQPGAALCPLPRGVAGCSAARGGGRQLSASQQVSLGLDNSSVTTENIPLRTPERPELQLRRV